MIDAIRLRKWPCNVSLSPLCGRRGELSTSTRALVGLYRSPWRGRPGLSRTAQPSMLSENRLAARLASLRQRGEKALGLFLTSGFPEPDATLPILEGLDRGGADFLELGMPFSDPLAEGPVIQAASARALAHGISMAATFRTAEHFRRGSETPLVLMGYVNPVLRYGVRAFCRDAAASGADGLILPDLPPEEATMIEDAAAEAGLALVFLVAPNTSAERMALIDGRSRGFVYAVSVTGVTGAALDRRDAVLSYLRQARACVRNNPLLVGFGLRTPADVAALCTECDGCIVGSALIQFVADVWTRSDLDHPSRLEQVSRFAGSLKEATLSPPA